ncbi:M6 family metalloprotease domain-containing protein [bacterium]|nr:M6 family metalloprotease domain-containing protein [bacterium]
MGPNTSHSPVRICAGLILAMILIASSRGLTPPAPGQIDAYKKDGSFEKRRAFAEKLGNHRVSPDLVKLKQAELSGGPTLQGFPYATGLQSKGTPRIVVLPVDFPDYHATIDDYTISDRLFGNGDGDPGYAPYESMTKYYKRSSYNQLTIQGDVMPRHRAYHNRSYYQDNAGALISETLNALNYSHDFSVYDNNGDGKIDYFILFWTGPDEGWASFWWSWNSNITDPNWKIDGKTLGNFSWICENNCIYSYNKFDPRTAIHETGHALGLPDYYDYDNSIGPKGGVGQTDMMDCGWHDHNAFSKWLLGWITPGIVGATGSVAKSTLRPSGLYGDAVAIMPGMSASNPFAEFYMVQNRAHNTKTASNDYYMPGEGLTIWHVDARLNSTNDNFRYDNSYTDHKLLKLMEADGGNHIEKNQLAAQADFYTANTYLSPISTPNSSNYLGARTGVTVFNIDPVTIAWPFPPAGTHSAQFVNAASSKNWMDIGNAVENTKLNWDTGGSSSAYTWFGQTTTYMNGGDAAECMPPGNGNNVTMGSRITGPGPLTFNWKVSSEPNKDWLEFYIDGTRQDRISGATNWAQKSYNITSGSHYIMWKYIKDSAGSSGSDCGWIDNVQYAFIPFNIAIDDNITTWTQSGNAVWFGQQDDFTFGGSAVRSGPIGDNQNSAFSATVTGPVNVDFVWKVSSERYDVLKLQLDGTNYASISGETDWTTKTLQLGSGTHVLKWQYIKNSSGKAGQDCGWVDHVRFSTPNLSAGVDNYVLPWLSIASTGWKYTTLVKHDGVDSVICNSLTQGQKATLRSIVTGPGTLKFWWKENTTSPSGYLQFKVDGAYSTAAFDEDWVQKTVAIADGTHLLEWIYQLDETASDYAAVDQVEYTPTNLSLAEALDAPEITWTTWGNPNGWSGVLMENAFGMDCARSGVIPDGYNTFLEGTVKGPALLTFNWKVSSQPRGTDYFAHDDLEFYLDDKQVDEINGEVGWQTKQYLLAKGEHKLTWDYYKDSTISAGQDCGWVDRVRVAALPSLNDALDNSSLIYWCGGSADWLGQPLLSYYGGSSAKSGEIVKGQKSTLVTSITGPARVGWYWKISANSMNRLELWIDGKYQISVAGSVDWKAESYYIQPGAHTVEWRYCKNSVFTDGSDCGWIDRMTVTSVPKANTQSWALYE